MKLFRPKYPAILRWLYPNRLSKVDNPKAIYLTFDDGPVPEATPWVLDLLKEFNAKATFFCIGENIEKYPDIFRRIQQEGHCTGNHTFNHLDGWKTKTREYLKNTRKAREIMTAETNQTFDSQTQNTETSSIKIFRPPFGKIKNSQAKKLVSSGYKIVMWDVISGDYDRDFSAEECYKNVIENATTGSTIVFHDSVKALKNLQEILPKILAYYKKKGMEFRSLKDVL
ncbi:polysaccharide deacetylase family protein [Christiangramia sabulilitoris]|uniref:Polysaccharide deacetylase family protein n=1 Tax=Christiangramia sabulilitoris TaxID=2583991 RepID=A0A550HZY1_9FLAO|nr:polysaccharide deacetylase family protein [Christiangramia sabulilitoris]TRO64284.1 polysaccharide deacetylase family protein [Christiangramia sabulilitoris]